MLLSLFYLIHFSLICYIYLMFVSIFFLFNSLRYYLSSHGASIDKAKDILRLQTHSMCRRQTLLKAAKQQWRHNMHESPDPEQAHQLEGIRKNLEEVIYKDVHLLIHMDSSNSYS